MLPSSSSLSLSLSLSSPLESVLKSSQLIIVCVLRNGSSVGHELVPLPKSTQSHGKIMPHAPGVQESNAASCPVDTKHRSDEDAAHPVRSRQAQRVGFPEENRHPQQSQARRSNSRASCLCWRLVVTCAHGTLSTRKRVCAQGCSEGLGPWESCRVPLFQGPTAKLLEDASSPVQRRWPSCDSPSNLTPVSPSSGSGSPTSQVG